MSIVVPSSKTSSLASTLIISFLIYVSDKTPEEDKTPRILNWNFPGLAFNEFNLSQYNIPLVSKIRFSSTSVNHSPHEYKALSSAKLQIAYCSIIINLSLINILNKINPSIDPRGKPFLTIY